MAERSGEGLASRHRSLVVGSALGAGLAVLVGVTTGNYLHLAGILGGLAVVGPVMIVLLRSHRRRRTDAAGTGAFGATANVYYENLKDIPRFRPVLGDFRMPWWVKLPSTLPRFERSVIGGAVRIDRCGIAWTPSAYRQRRGMRDLRIPLDDISSVAVRPLMSIGRGGVLEISLGGGGVWLLSVLNSDEALSYLQQLGCRTEPTPLHGPRRTADRPLDGAP